MINLPKVKEKTGFHETHGVKQGLSQNLTVRNHLWCVTRKTSWSFWKTMNIKNISPPILGGVDRIFKRFCTKKIKIIACSIVTSVMQKAVTV